MSKEQYSRDALRPPFTKVCLIYLILLHLYVNESVGSVKISDILLIRTHTHRRTKCNITCFPGIYSNAAPIHSIALQLHVGRNSSTTKYSTNSHHVSNHDLSTVECK